MKSFYQYGFWWWFDPKRNGWFTGCAPAFGSPAWAGDTSEKGTTT